MVRRIGPRSAGPFAVKAAAWGAWVQAAFALVAAASVLGLVVRWAHDDEYIAGPWSPVVLLAAALLAALGLTLRTLAVRLAAGSRTALATIAVFDSVIVLVCFTFVAKNILDHAQDVWISRRAIAIGGAVVPLVTLASTLSPTAWRWAARTNRSRPATRPSPEPISNEEAPLRGRA